MRKHVAAGGGVRSALGMLDERALSRRALVACVDWKVEVTGDDIAYATAGCPHQFAIAKAAMRAFGLNDQGDSAAVWTDELIVQRGLELHRTRGPHRPP